MLLIQFLKFSVKSYIHLIQNIRGLFTLTQQAANGTPVQIAYEVTGTIHSIQSQNIMALPGATTVACDSGTIEVAGKVYPDVIFQDLYKKIDALTNGGM